MASPPTISLFTERTDLSRQPGSILVSLVVHCGVVALVWFGVVFTPQIRTNVITERYSVRNLDMHIPPEELQRLSKGSELYPEHRRDAKASSGQKDAHAPVLQQVVKAQPSLQTLFQPDLRAQDTLKEELPVPTVVLWTPSKAPVKNIVAPQPVKLNASVVTPSPERPNQEPKLADINLAAAEKSSLKVPTLPSTTSPVVVHGPQAVQAAPQTVSQTAANPTPATVLSISDLTMKDGTVTLPPVNETARANAPGELAPGAGHEASEQGSDGKEGAGGGSGAAHTAGSTSATAPGAPGTEDQKTGVGQGNQISRTAITLPKEGHFSSVVVGNSLENQFPEIAGMWSGRMAYTVYLHVGLAKSWILQYSLPRADEAATSGNIAHLDAPWPYNIVRPNFGSDAVDADALIVHGFVNQSGRFETLSVVFPQAFTLAQFVLSSLEQWQFRPAMQNGQGARIEVLLIIPEELN